MRRQELYDLCCRETAASVREKLDDWRRREREEGKGGFDPKIYFSKSKGDAKGDSVRMPKAALVKLPKLTEAATKEGDLRVTRSAVHAPKIHSDCQLLVEFEKCILGWNGAVFLSLIHI